MKIDTGACFAHGKKLCKPTALSQHQDTCGMSTVVLSQHLQIEWYWCYRSTLQLECYWCYHSTLQIEWYWCYRSTLEVTPSKYNQTYKQVSHWGHYYSGAIVNLCWSNNRMLFKALYNGIQKKNTLFWGYLGAMLNLCRAKLCGLYVIAGFVCIW